jgi:hypothetical protein
MAVASLQDLRHGHESGREVEVNSLGSGVGAGDKRMVAVGDQDSAAVTGSAEYVEYRRVQVVISAWGHPLQRDSILAQKWAGTIGE